MLLPSDNWFLGWGETNLGGRKPNPRAGPWAGIPCCCAHSPYGAERTLLGAYTYLQSRQTTCSTFFPPSRWWTLSSPRTTRSSKQGAGKNFLKVLELVWVLQARAAMILGHSLALLSHLCTLLRWFHPCEMARAGSNDLYGLLEFSGASMYCSSHFQY